MKPAAASFCSGFATHDTKDRLHDQPEMLAEINDALATGSLKLKNDQKIRHMVEGLIEDIGCEESLST